MALARIVAMRKFTSQNYMPFSKILAPLWFLFTPVLALSITTDIPHRKAWDGEARAFCDDCLSVGIVPPLGEQTHMQNLLQPVSIVIERRVADKRVAGAATGAIGAISDDITKGQGTAFLISPCHIVTCQHNSYMDFKSETPTIARTNMKFYFGQGNDHGFASHVDADPLIPNEVMHYARSGLPNDDDYKVYRLRNCFKDDYPVLTLSPLPLVEAMQTPFSLMGQPTHVADATKQNNIPLQNPNAAGVWHDDKCIIDGEFRLDRKSKPNGDFTTTCNSSDGQSGSPLVYQTKESENVYVMGIACGSYEGAGKDKKQKDIPDYLPIKDMRSSQETMAVPIYRVYHKIIDPVNDDLLSMNRPRLPIQSSSPDKIRTASD
jgi:hypothetical protein